MEEDLEKELQDLIAEANAEQEELEDDNEEVEEEELEDNEEELDSGSEEDNDSIEDEDLDDKLDGSTETDDITAKDESDEIEDKPKASNDFEPIEVEVDGSMISIESKEELLALAKKGLSPAQKARKDSDIETMAKQGGLSQADLALIIDAKNGDVNAIAKLAQIGNIDVLDIEEEKADQYKQGFQISRESEVEIAAGEIMQDAEHADVFRNTIQNIGDEDFVKTISADANKLKAFSSHIKRGLAQKVIPLVKKEMALNGGNFYDNYAKIGLRLSKESSVPNAKTEVQNPNRQEEKPARQISEKEKKLRARANGGDKSESTGNRGKITADDIMDMSDEKFAEYIASK